MCRQNENVRKAARVAGIPLWMVASKIQVSEPTLTRWLRFPLPEEKEQRIMSAIQELQHACGECHRLGRHL